MIHRPPLRAIAALCGALIAMPLWHDAPEVQAQSGARRPLSYDAYDSWRAIEGTTLSRDGEWLAYALTSQGADGELVVRNLRSGAELRHPRGTSPAFTPDGRFVIFTIQQTKDEEEKAAKEAAEAPPSSNENRPRNTPPRTSAGVMSLPAGEVSVVERVGTFSMPAESSAWVAFHRSNTEGRGRGGRGGRGRGGAAPGAGGTTAQEPAAARGRNPDGTPRAKRKDPGSDLVVRNLAAAHDVTIPLVTDFAWAKDGSWLAYAVSSSKPEEDGAFARRMSDGSVVALQKGKGNFKELAFDDGGRQLAFVSDWAAYDKDVSPYRLYYWKTGDASATELVSEATRGMPNGMAVSENFAPRFSEDGQRLFLGTAPLPAAPAPEGTPAPRGVDIWSYQDPLIQPMQKVRAQQERTRTYRAVMHLADRRFVQLATQDLPTVTPDEDAARALGTSDLPYRKEISWDASYSDVYVVDLKTGQRRKALEHWRATASLSPGGKYVLAFDESNGDWIAWRAADGQKVNLTEKLDVHFWQEDHDTPNLPPAYGSAGWTADDKSVLLYDKYDIWEIRPDGSGAHMITGGEGRRQQLVFRYRPLDPTLRTIPSDKPILLSANDDRTEANGLYRASVTASSPPEKLVMLDKSFGTIVKAKNADRAVVPLSRFDEFPNLWTSDLSFKELKKVSDANPQQAEYVWGRSELMQYTNADGKVLRAVLTRPDDFDPAKKYPLMVYIYEELSEGLHSYRTPAPGTSINITRYVSNGYVVLQPDIAYGTGYPGESAEKCVIPAVERVVAMGFIDPKRIGIQGHSWGGFQITHLVTRTNMFAAVEAGASVSNMISAYGGIRWGTGMSRAFQYEKTQSRIGAAPWDAPLQFIENSPIFWVKKVQTPYLTIHNDEDDAVPWYQGIEFYSAMRRLGKEAYMFVYNGEPHGLRQRDNMKHWTVHMDEFFDHFLLGKPKPDWMTSGVPYLERGKRDVSGIFKRKAAVTTPTAQDEKDRQ